MRLGEERTRPVSSCHLLLTAMAAALICQNYSITQNSLFAQSNPRVCQLTASIVIGTRGHH